MLLWCRLLENTGKQRFFARWFASNRSNLPSIIKSRRVHRSFKFSQKSHTHQVLTHPERIPQFTAMRPAASTTIDRFSRSQYHIYLCTQASLLSTSASVRVRGGNHVT